MEDIAYRNLTNVDTPMDNTNPIDLLFGGMEKLGPGSNADTLHVLSLLPRQQFHLVVDVGCGTGRQTLALATELGTRVHAVDSYEPFLSDLAHRAAAALNILREQTALCRQAVADYGEPFKVYLAQLVSVRVNAGDRQAADELRSGLTK
jgi:protein-L-isoaspartate O-methyltransferase